MRGTLSVAGRILLSLKGDHRTLGLVLVVPVFIIFLFSEILDEVPPGRFNADFVKPVLLGFFVYFLTYLLAAVGFLRERQSGTLERVLSSSLSRSGLVLGYLLGFGALVTVQAGVLLGAGILFLDVEFQHGVLPFFLLELLGAISALGLGILASLFARNEFQVIQFIPALIAPQVILGGVFVPVESLPAYLEYPARVLPLTYLLKGMNYVVLDQGGSEDVLIAIAVLGAYTLVSILLAGLVVRRAA